MIRPLRQMAIGAERGVCRKPMLLLEDRPAQLPGAYRQIGPLHLHLLSCCALSFEMVGAPHSKSEAATCIFRETGGRVRGLSLPLSDGT